MFTGLVEGRAIVRSVIPDGDGVRLGIEFAFDEEITIGQSIAINGVCLTVTGTDANRFDMTAVEETLKLTALSRLEVGSRVNVERSLKLGDRLDGHLVLGHVDDVANVAEVRESTPGKVVSFTLNDELRRYVARKGSVTINGVSLTVAQLEPNGFNVALVPHTLQVTTLDELRAGDRVNLEVDIVARYVERLVSAEGVLDGKHT